MQKYLFCFNYCDLFISLEPFIVNRFLKIFTKYFFNKIYILCWFVIHKMI